MDVVFTISAFLTVQPKMLILTKWPLQVVIIESNATLTNQI